MRFSCGKTSDQKFRDYERRAAGRMAKLKQWHTRFAWLPITIDEQDGYKVCVWLQRYECRVRPNTPDILLGLLLSHDWECRLPETERN